MTKEEGTLAMLKAMAEEPDKNNAPAVVRQVAINALAMIEELGRICGESYQVVGILASEAHRFNDPFVIRALDNLSRQELMHEDVLPFPIKEQVRAMR